MKAGEEMPRQDAFTPYDGEQGVATGAYHTYDLSVMQIQSLHIGRMHFQHVCIDQF